MTLQGDTSQPNKAVYQATVTNDGAGTATGVTLLIDLPFSFGSLTIDPVLNCVTIAASYLCDIGNLAPHDQRSFTLHALPLVSGSVTFTVTGAMNETDPTPQNNQASYSSMVTAEPDIQVTITHDSDVVGVGDTIHHHITITNVGGLTATNLEFDAPLPDGIEDDSWSWGYSGSPFTCKFDQRDYSCASAQVYPGATLYLDLYSHADTEGMYTFKTLATISEQDANLADNNPSLVTTVSSSSLSLPGTIAFQGRPSAPSPLLSVPLSVKVTPDGTTIPVIDTTVTTDNNGSFTLDGLTAGTYTVWVKASSSLSKTSTVTLPTATPIDFGTLLEGDADGNNVVNLTDFSILAVSFGKQSTDSGFDPRADFNGDGIVNLTDFSLLASNFGQSGMS